MSRELKGCGANSGSFFRLALVSELVQSVLGRSLSMIGSMGGEEAHLGSFFRFQCFVPPLSANAELGPAPSPGRRTELHGLRFPDWGSPIAIGFVLSSAQVLELMLSALRHLPGRRLAPW
jgi:hypothetical protein